MFVDHPLLRYIAGLVVDLDDPYFHFKLVTVDRKCNCIFSEENIMRFTVLVPSSSGVVVKSQADLVCRSYIRIRSRPVYAHGCLHWLGNQAKEMVVFDVKKEKARIINGPIGENEPVFDFHYEWFGFADGSLQFVYSLPQEIVIQSHNYHKEEWQVKHKLANIRIPGNKYYKAMDCMPLFFDGQRLFFKKGKREEYGLVVMYDILSDKWEKMGIIERSSDDRQPFFSFFPTLAKVSDMYLHNYKTEFPSKGSSGLLIKNGFEGLRHVMMHMKHHL